ncbi:hypothetical protein M2459_002283 [Parabacteroides sp. PF5-5]|nr:MULTISPECIES: hypothetical protein [unclassified Parabacteroides]MDH6305186.1 hypothetical protein [Parabacteroides sp. PH5-39]MDH6316536.1 hypothetical protein [Parabacteroides sp. PF5-13]MDH6320046.1 hypothetical protein [Parabacteroides sp. PH5-13]MDH6323721.1 hypothetical protein [Parabacteroides sp. PH5-8]MDH6327723.1 hypothetical protein [Parabacteroides sp. PH5-41]
MKKIWKFIKEFALVKVYYSPETTYKAIYILDIYFLGIRIYRQRDDK